MGRLTERSEYGTYFYKECFEKCNGAGCSEKCNQCHVEDDIAKKLGQYEDLAEPMKIKEIHVDEYYCPACGSENTCNNKVVEHKFCPNCGQRIVS